MVTTEEVRHPAAHRKGSQVVQFQPKQPKEPYISIHETRGIQATSPTGASTSLYADAPSSGMHYAMSHKGTSSSQAMQYRDTEQEIASSLPELGSASLYKKRAVSPTSHPAVSGKGFSDDSDDDSALHQRGRCVDLFKVQDDIEDLHSGEQQNYHNSSMKHHDDYPVAGSSTYENYGSDPEDLSAQDHSSRSGLRLTEADTLRMHDNRESHSSSPQPQYRRSRMNGRYPIGRFVPGYPLAYGHPSRTHRPSRSVMQH